MKKNNLEICKNISERTQKKTIENNEHFTSRKKNKSLPFALFDKKKKDMENHWN